MDKIILDPSALTTLGKLDHFAKLCDPSGRTIGYFTPAASHIIYEEGEIPPTTEEELRRREQEPGAYTTAEVLSYLEKLPPRESA